MVSLPVRVVRPCLVLPGLLLVLACISTVHAQDGTVTNSPMSLTGRGRVMLDGDIAGYWSSDASGTPWRSYPDWLVSFTPSASYFVVDHIGVGASLGAAVSHSTMEELSFSASSSRFETRRRHVIAGVHMVFDIPCGKRFSILSRITAGWGRIWSRLYAEVPAYLVQPQLSGDSAPVEPLSTVRVSVPYDASVLRGALSLRLVLYIRDFIGLGLGPELIVDHIGTDDRDEGAIQALPSSSGFRTRAGLGTWLGGSF